MTPGRSGHTFFIAIAQLALVAYLFQIVALDHWRLDPAHAVTGVEGSQEHLIHEDHCHGGSASCAGGAVGGLAYVKFAEAVALPSPPSVIIAALSMDLPVLQGAPSEALTPPPRTA